jgi:hypothetical protein
VRNTRPASPRRRESLRLEASGGAPPAIARLRPAAPAGTRSHRSTPALPALETWPPEPTAGRRQHPAIRDSRRRHPRAPRATAGRRPMQRRGALREVLRHLVSPKSFLPESLTHARAVVPSAASDPFRVRMRPSVWQAASQTSSSGLARRHLVAPSARPACVAFHTIVARQRVLSRQKPGPDAAQRGVRPARDGVGRVLSRCPDEGTHDEEPAVVLRACAHPASANRCAEPRRESRLRSGLVAEISCSSWASTWGAASSIRSIESPLMPAMTAACTSLVLLRRASQSPRTREHSTQRRPSARCRAQSPAQGRCPKIRRDAPAGNATANGGNGQERMVRSHIRQHGTGL